MTSTLFTLRSSTYNTSYTYSFHAGHAPAAVLPQQGGAGNNLVPMYFAPVAPLSKRLCGMLAPPADSTPPAPPPPMIAGTALSRDVQICRQCGLPRSSNGHGKSGCPNPDPKGAAAYEEERKRKRAQAAREARKRGKSSE
ncbi:hypothetical protein NFJ02_29g68520 [Pycnococcus provasolii]